MAQKNLGKNFEQVVKRCFEKVDGVSIDRLRDAPGKFKNVDNPSDFIVYKKPHEIYVECKTHRGNTLPFSCIRNSQIAGMLEKERVEGVKCGFIVWYIDRDMTIWYPIKTVAYLQMLGRKSLHFEDKCNSPYVLRIFGTKKNKRQRYWDYDMERFLKDLFKSFEEVTDDGKTGQSSNGEDKQD